MSAFRQAQPSFVMGEISKDASARIDLEEFRQSVRLMQNFLPLPSGGARKRPGTRFIREIEDLSAGDYGPTLIPFEFPDQDSYVVCIKPDNTVPVVGDKTKQFIQIFLNDAGGSRIGVDTGILTFTYPYALPLTLDPAGFTFARAGDQMFITHESRSVPPIVITRLASASFRVSDLPTALTSTYVGFDVEEALRTPYRKNFTPTTLQPSGISGVITITASANIFDPAHVDTTYVKITQGAKTGVALIDGYISPTQVNASVVTKLSGSELTFFDTSASDNWHISEWNGVDGYPGAVGVYEGRTVWAGSRSKKDTLWFSLAGNLFHLMEERLEQDKGSTDNSGLRFFGDIAADDPFTKIASHKNNNSTSWIDSSSNLEVGTLGGEYVVKEGDDGTFQGGNTRIRVQSTNGSKRNKALRISDRLLFLSRDGKKVRDFKFNSRNASHVSNDITLLNSQIHRFGDIDANEPAYDSDKFIDMAHQASRETSWFLNARHALCAVTISAENKGVGWSRHSLGGDGTVNVWGIAATANNKSENDDLYMIVDRTINGARKFYLEKMGKDFDSDTLNGSSEAGTYGIDSPLYEIHQPLFLDCHHREVASSAANTITGIGHLEAQTVVATVNGEKQPGTYTVSAGAITLSANYAVGDVLCVGLPYTAELNFHDPEAGGEKGDAEGAIKQIDRLDLDLFRSFKLTAGFVGGQFDEKVPFSTSDVEDDFHEVKIHGNPAKQQIPYIRSEDPYPCTLLSIVFRGQTHD